MRAAIATLLVLALCGRGEARDHRVLWVHDGVRGRDVRVAPFGRHGVMTRRAKHRLAALFAARGGQRYAVDSRLVRVLRQVQERFGRRRLELESGYRVPPAASYHGVGHAADIRIEGVPNRALFAYCRSLRSLGCGLYPNGAHVHVDVRSAAVIWVDLAPYGEAALYAPDPVAWLEAHPDAGGAALGNNRRGAR